MSEELLQTTPYKIGKYTYYKLGNTTLDQLKAHGIIPKKNYGELKKKKPDGLITHHNTVVAVVEYKTPSKLSTDKDLDKAISQEIEVARRLCSLLIITDGSQSFWINALNAQPIVDAKDNQVRVIFHPFGVKGAAEVEHLLDEIAASINATNSAIRSAKIIDPTPLATRLWQTIWVATGKSPIKCLYNVVELFIFKFLSDLKVLADDIAFDRIYEKALSDPQEALDFYAKNSRAKINQLFPPGSDSTTIINGTIFVNEQGIANPTQAHLFKACLGHLKRYTEAFWRTYQDRQAI